jgi:hypothetical protein
MSFYRANKTICVAVTYSYCTAANERLASVTAARPVNFVAFAFSLFIAGLTLNHSSIYNKNCKQLIRSRMLGIHTELTTAQGALTSGFEVVTAASDAVLVVVGITDAMTMVRALRGRE